MAAMIAHRGPNEFGLYTDGEVGLTNTRLSIIDLVGGSQPIHNEDRSVWLTFNGEIFNYVELRRDLVALGHSFYTESDSEVIVHAYEEYGSDAWSRFNGQFAFALWDQPRGLLWLVRDPFGIHPLFYARGSSHVVFASELKAVFAGGRVTPQPHADGLVDAFVTWAAQPPTTVFAGVRQVRPGTAVAFDGALAERELPYWAPRFDADAILAHLDEREAAEVLEARLTTALQLRLRADVPVGAYLSGGLDSSVIAAMLRRLHSGTLRTFAIRFEDPAFDETPAQRRMAQLLGTDHHEITCGPAEIRAALPEVVWHCETPLMRTAPVPLFLLSGLVRREGMKVVMTGEGADELFAGYSLFKEDKVRRFWARRPDSRLRPALFSRLHPEIGRDRARRTELWQQFFGRRLGEVEHPFYSHLVRWENTAWTTRVLHADVRQRTSTRSGAEGVPPELDLPDAWMSWSALARAQWLEITTFMSPYLLASQGDRVALAHGVEVRYPFLDLPVAELAMGSPDRLRMRGLKDKLLLRTVASRYVPPDIALRPKYPFRAPTSSALFGSALPGYVDDLLSEAAVERLGLLDPTAARLLLQRARRLEGRMAGEREEMALVGMLTTQLWGEMYFESFARRSSEARARFDSAPTVVVDRTVAGSDEQLVASRG